MASVLLFICLGGGERTTFYLSKTYTFLMNLLLLLEHEFTSHCLGPGVFRSSLLL